MSKCIFLEGVYSWLHNMAFQRRQLFTANGVGILIEIMI